MPLSLARMVWKKKYLVLTIWVLLSIGAFIFAKQMPNVFSTEAVIVVDSQKIPERYISATVDSTVLDRLAAIREQVLSTQHIKKIVEEFRLYRDGGRNLLEEEIFAKFRKDVTVSMDNGGSTTMPGAFRVGYQGTDPETVAKVANRLANLFIEENLKVRETVAEGTSEFIESQLAVAKQKLDELETAVSRYKVEHNGELPQQQLGISGALSRLQVQLEANRDAINRTQQNLVMLQNDLSAAEEAQAQEEAVLRRTYRTPSKSGDSGATVLPVRRDPQVIRLANELEQLRSRYKSGHPEVKALEARLALAREEERLLAAAEPPASSATSPVAEPLEIPGGPDTTELKRQRSRVALLKSQIELAKQETEHLKRQQQGILSEIGVNEAKLQRLPIREQEMAQVTRDYEIWKSNYQTLLNKKLSAEMATEMERRQKSERFTLLEPARVPELPAKPLQKKLVFGGGSIAGLVVGLLLALGLELKRNTFLGRWELSQDTVVLGVLPYIDVKSMSSPAAPPWKTMAVIGSSLFVLFTMAGIYLWRSGIVG